MKKHTKILLGLFMMFLLTATCISMRISAATIDENTTIGGTWSDVAWQLDGGTGELIISKKSSGSGYMNPFSTILGKLRSLCTE